MVKDLKRLRDTAWKMANKFMDSDDRFLNDLGLAYTIVAQTLDYVLDGKGNPLIEYLVKEIERAG